MQLSDAQKREYVKRLLFSRMRLLIKNGFYGLLLMHTSFALDDSIQTACTDGGKIYFSPKFLSEISDSELDFVMSHEILHIVLKHCLRTGDRDPELFNIACDIVVNSNIMLSADMDPNAVTLKKYGELMHTAPNGEEGNKYTAEEVYQMLLSPSNKVSRQGGRGFKAGNGRGYGKTWDDHSRWGSKDGDTLLKDMWDKYVRDVAEAISIQKSNGGRGVLPLGVERMLDELRDPTLDWRALLADFVSEDVSDYSFAPPDRRYTDGDFFIPDLNLGGETVRNILFMVDASGSVSDSDLTSAFSEIKGAIEQFDGRLEGYLGFFDSAVYKPVPFGDVNDLLGIKPRGGGGTDFYAIFNYIFKNMQDNLPASIIILTDGFAPIPPAEVARGIPVLWILDNKIITPSWGRIARIDT